MERRLPAIALVALVDRRRTGCWRRHSAAGAGRAPPLAPRIGVADAPLSLTLADADRMTLEQNNDVSIARLDTDDRAAERARGRGRLRSAGRRRTSAISGTSAPNTSAIGGATEGRLERTEIDGGAGMIGRTPWAGGRFTVDFSASRLDTSNQFARLNPEFPSALTRHLRAAAAARTQHRRRAPQHPAGAPRRRPHRRAADARSSWTS